MNSLLEPKWINKGSNFINPVLALNEISVPNQSSNWGLYQRQRDVILTQNIFNLFRIACVRAGMQIQGAPIDNVDTLLNLMFKGYYDDNPISINPNGIAPHNLLSPTEIYCGASMVLGDNFNYIDLDNILRSLGGAVPAPAAGGLITDNIVIAAAHAAATIKAGGNAGLIAGISAPNPTGIRNCYIQNISPALEGASAVLAAIAMLRLKNQETATKMVTVFRELNNNAVITNEIDQARAILRASIADAAIITSLINASTNGLTIVDHLAAIYTVAQGSTPFENALFVLSGKQNLINSLYGDGNGFQSDLTNPVTVQTGLLFNYANNKLELFKRGDGTIGGGNDAIFPDNNSVNSFFRSSGVINGVLNTGAATPESTTPYPIGMEIRYKYTFRHLLDIAQIFENITDQTPNSNNLLGGNLNFNIVNGSDPLSSNGAVNLSLKPNDFIAYIHKLIRRDQSGVIPIAPGNPSDIAAAQLGTVIRETFNEAIGAIYQELGQWITNFYSIRIDDDAGGKRNIQIALKVSNALTASMKYMLDTRGPKLPTVFNEMETNLGILGDKIHKLTGKLQAVYKELRESRNVANDDWIKKLDNVASNSTTNTYDFVMSGGANIGNKDRYNKYRPKESQQEAYKAHKLKMAQQATKSQSSSSKSQHVSERSTRK